MEIEYEWDESKNRKNIQKHGFDFNDAHLLFNNLYLLFEDTRFDYGEIRYKAVGTICGRTVILLYTEKQGKKKIKRRIISLRKADEKERRKYQKRLV